MRFEHSISQVKYLDQQGFIFSLSAYPLAEHRGNG
jgi:hypothetical protein